MKKYILIAALMFSVLCMNVAAQTKSYPFEVLKTGKGKQAILFIPGFASSADVWNEIKANFEKDFTCYALTMAGFAGVKPQPNVTFEHWETEIANYVKNNKIEKPILIGHSMGGVLALAIAADYPELIGKIVVVDALPSLSALMNPSFQSKENNDCSPMVNQITAMTDSQFYDMQKMSIPRLVENASKKDLIIEWSVKSDRKTFAEMYCDFSNTDLREKIATIKCPTLILLEAYFVNLKPAIEAQYKNLKTANLQYANKGLHFIMYDDPTWYLEQLNNFIK
ncbi:alpha/beta hydrolase [Flavobacterium sp. Fl-77]|uniref:Alpha/beta hydrolase n=1 Tax=Flavobacterium flavipigmentatum TaxID=2893884 RepID=A0AAJ2VZP4_9FLAO|nr:MULTISPECIES: alpha/beta hydrolase [unclassified Flavobacterium]MDX6180595.1 alpha/beta hydrolase [Flavobacterium sp. Fl-33]MDX6184195.1 alpha/beta hydrolase [Flavobacterium sp. Fl-77]UFH39308.1 alpha/beta hydrolase [Flavobacterium sp. F-70]